MIGAETEKLAARLATILQALQRPVAHATAAAETLLLPTRFPLQHGMQAFSKQARRPTVCFAECSPTKRRSDVIHNGRNYEASALHRPLKKTVGEGLPSNEISQCLMGWFEKTLIPFRVPSFPRWTNPGWPTGRRWGRYAAGSCRHRIAGGAKPNGSASSCREPRGAPCALKNESEGTQTMIARNYQIMLPMHSLGMEQFARPDPRNSLAILRPDRFALDLPLRIADVFNGPGGQKDRPQGIPFRDLRKTKLGNHCVGEARFRYEGRRSTWKEWQAASDGPWRPGRTSREEGPRQPTTRNPCRVAGTAIAADRIGRRCGPNRPPLPLPPTRGCGHRAARGPKRPPLRLRQPRPGSQPSRTVRRTAISGSQPSRSRPPTPQPWPPPGAASLLGRASPATGSPMAAAPPALQEEPKDSSDGPPGLRRRSPKGSPHR